MAYDGYLSFGGNEVINNPRARGIQETLDCPAFWLRGDECDTLKDALVPPVLGEWQVVATNLYTSPTFASATGVMPDHHVAYATGGATGTRTTADGQASLFGVTVPAGAGNRYGIQLVSADGVITGATDTSTIQVAAEVTGLLPLAANAVLFVEFRDSAAASVGTITARRTLNGRLVGSSTVWTGVPTGYTATLWLDGGEAGLAIAGGTAVFSEPIIEVSNTLDPYFDGSMPLPIGTDPETNRVSWTGPVNGSSSILERREITVAPPYTADGLPDAPWYDPSNPDVSSRFYGVYGIDILGLEDSTRQVQLTEGITDGGTIGRTRRAMREVRVTAWLMARGSEAMEYGRAWLDAVLSPGACGQHGTECGSTDLTFFAECPPDRGSDVVFGPWVTVARNIFPNPRATDLDAFGGVTAYRTPITDFPDVDVPTAARFTRNSVGVLGMMLLGIGDAEWRTDGSPVRLLTTVQASEAMTVNIYARNSMLSATNQSTLVAGLALVPGVNVIDITGAYPAAGAIDPGQAGFYVEQAAGPAIGSTFDMTKVLVERNPITETSWFDGNQPDGPLQQFVWEGTPGGSPSIAQTRDAATLPEPVADWEARIASLTRYLHNVAVTSGPLTKQEVLSNGFYGQLVEWVFTAGRPWVYGLTQTVDLPTSDNVVVQDIPYNLVPYPSAELAGADVVIARNYSTNPSVESASTGWSAATSASSGASATPYVSYARSTDIAAVGVASLRVRLLGNGTTAATGGVTLDALQTVSLAGVSPASRVSFNVWAATLISAGAAGSTLGGLSVWAEWLDATNAVVLTEHLANASGLNGEAMTVPSRPIPATATQVRVRVSQVVTKWTSSTTPANNSDIRFYIDALAVTVP